MMSCVRSLAAAALLVLPAAAQNTICDADLDGDLVVDVDDLLVLLSAYGGSAAGDMNADGQTNVNDLLILLGNYGGTCTQSATACLTAVAGDSCFGHVEWAMSTGFPNHPEWYPGITAASTFEDCKPHYKPFLPAAARAGDPC